MSPLGFKARVGSLLFVFGEGVHLTRLIENFKCNFLKIFLGVYREIDDVHCHFHFYRNSSEHSMVPLRCKYLLEHEAHWRDDVCND